VLHGSPTKRVLTVGKIYAGLLVLENYRSYKQSLAKYGEARPRQSSFFNRIMGVVRSNASQHKSNSTINLEETSSKANHNSFKNNIKNLNLPNENQNVSRRSSMNFETTKNNLKNSASTNRISDDMAYLTEVY
jgi:hypothetical protein